jgi:hypothetical protein
LRKSYRFRFFFDFGGCCVWGNDVNIPEENGCGLPIEKLPLSKELLAHLNELMGEFETSIDWDYPPNPSPWTTEQRIDFLNRATAAYERLKTELGEDYEVINELHFHLDEG